MMNRIMEQLFDNNGRDETQETNELAADDVGGEFENLEMGEHEGQHPKDETGRALIGQRDFQVGSGGSPTYASPQDEGAGRKHEINKYRHNRFTN